jgi:hypothetical protein
MISTPQRVKRIIIEPNPSFRKRLNRSLQLRKPETLTMFDTEGERVGWMMKTSPQLSGHLPPSKIGVVPQKGIPGRTLQARQVLLNQPNWYRELTLEDLHKNYRKSVVSRKSAFAIAPTSQKVSSIPQIFTSSNPPGGGKPGASNQWLIGLAVVAGALYLL